MACSVYELQILLEALYQSGKDGHALVAMTLEAWNPKVKLNLTLSHAWAAAPANIIFRYLFGVRPLVPGDTSILIAPQPSTLKWMRGKVLTHHGPVMVSLKNDARPQLEIKLPPGRHVILRQPAVR